MKTAKFKFRKNSTSDDLSTVVIAAIPLGIVLAIFAAPFVSFVWATIFGR